MTSLELQNLTIVLDEKPIIQDLDLMIQSPEFLVLLGPSGSGKTTILRSINGFIAPSKGSVKIDDVEVNKATGEILRKIRREIGVVYQGFNLVERLDVMKNVLCGRLGYLDPLGSSLGDFPPEDVKIAENCLRRVRMMDKAGQRADSLSGGEKQRVAIARALAQRPSILLADEPVANLDYHLSHDIMRLLISIWKEEKGIMVLATHDLELVRRFCRGMRVIGVKEGKKVHDGLIKELDTDTLKKIYGDKDELLF